MGCLADVQGGYWGLVTQPSLHRPTHPEGSACEQGENIPSQLPVFLEHDPPYLRGTNRAL